MVDNIDVKDGGGATRTLATKDNAGVHIPKRIPVTSAGVEHPAPPAVGQTTMANSLPVVLASNQSDIQTKLKQSTTASSAGYVAAKRIKASGGQFYGMTGYNAHSAGLFVQVHDFAGATDTTPPTAGASPQVILWVPAGANFSLDYGPRGRQFATGITVAVSTTGPTYTAPVLAPPAGGTQYFFVEGQFD